MYTYVFFLDNVTPRAKKLADDQSHHTILDHCLSFFSLLDVGIDNL